ncbi:unnamed protein product [Prorocentrum cordatum]|uniref:Uncharacterized protein n=1 Tax=Prorocentrum cordatum TaxID=2364126 RepID=A0ABN9W0Z6_9DINO|nr:unnamed protein product [Polarella glacialis]
MEPETGSPPVVSIIEQFLRSYGYDAADDGAWRAPPGTQTDLRPALELKVDDHQELGSHTFYVVECRLTVPGAPKALAWKASRRLEEMRQQLHGPVKEGLGKDDYARLFESHHFAPRGGMPGTTTRLSKWCDALAACVNSGECPPRVVAHVLAFLSAPKPPSAFGRRARELAQEAAVDAVADEAQQAREAAEAAI